MDISSANYIQLIGHRHLWAARYLSECIFRYAFKDAFPQNVDIIFCRNVMIYFDREHQKSLVANFYRSLSKTNGYLYIGHSETLHAISEDFMYVKLLDSPVYVPKERINEFSAG